MQANTLTPFELFGNQVRYVVPMFQRPYVWNQEDQWEPLWEDVRTVAERILDAGNSQPLFNAEPLPGHFLGAIVLDQQLVPAPYISVRHIIDGQQRLTTLQLLLDAVEEVVRVHGTEADGSALRSLVLNNAQVALNPDDVFKVWPTNYDRDAFRAVMDDGIAVDGDHRNSRLFHAHRYFGAEVSEWADIQGDPAKVKARLNALTRALSQHLRVVVIDLQPGDNAQVIFETLNHRGTPLLASDLVKNFVFQAAEAQGADVDDVYERYWKPFDAPRWRSFTGRGRQQRPRIDVFLNYWLVMHMAREVPGDRIFSDFRTFVLSDSRPIVDRVADLASSADVFDQLESQPWTSVEGTFAYRVLSVLEQTAWGPWLLWIYGQGDALPREQREQALRAVESWAVRRMLVRATTKGTTRLVIDLLEALRACEPNHVGVATEEFLAGETAEARYWPTDQQVIDSCLTLPLYRTITRARLRMTLEALEDSLRTPKAEEENCVRGRLTIEHIMPQGWREHWPLPADGHPELLATERDQMLHTLGNLTLVNGKLNPALSNRPWLDYDAADRGLGHQGKRSILGEHSVLFLNKEVIDSFPEGWSEGDIHGRSIQMANRILEIWKRPLTTLNAPVSLD